MNDHDSLQDDEYLYHASPSLDVAQLQQLKTWPELRNDDSGKEVAPTNWQDQTTPAATGRSETLPQKKRIKLPWLITGTFVLVAIIVAAVLGGVLGSKTTRTSERDADSGATLVDPPPSPSFNPSITPSASPTNKPQPVSQGSALTVTGWRKLDGIDIFLVYQDSQSALRFSRYDNNSLQHAIPTNDSFWGPSTNINSTAKAGTRLGVGIILDGDIFQVWRASFLSYILSASGSCMF